MSLYTREEVETFLRDAHEAVEAAAVPDDLRPQAFAAAVQALAAKTAALPMQATDLSRLARR